MRMILVLFFFSSLQYLKGQEEMTSLDIGILSVSRPQAIQVIPEKGAYAVIADGQNIATLRAGDRATLAKLNDLVKLSFPHKVAGRFYDIRLMALHDSSYFRLYVLTPEKYERVYDDHLLVKAVGENLRLINRVDLEKYIAGVVEAESGKEKPVEFYKVQAIISRTYALSNRRRFAASGFNLSDETDSQVYHGKCRWEPIILEAVQATAGKVLVDSEMRLITAAFHSNSGGETIGSESVWSGPLPYLSPRKDEFSRNGDHYRWVKMIHRDDWLNYLRDSFDIDLNDRKLVAAFVKFDQDRRKQFLGDPKYGIPLTKIRKDMSLNSTFFELRPKGDSIRIDGKGFGHGAGLSQEGAMRMAALGFSYPDILHFYYDDVHIIDLRALEFFLKE
jgi:stage II sporulation protein D